MSIMLDEPSMANWRRRICKVIVIVISALERA